MKKNQNGFTFIEVMMVLIFVVLVSFVGWYVLQSKGKDTSHHQTSTSTDQTTKTTGRTVDTSKFVFKELGVQITLSNDLKGLSYHKNTLTSDETYDLNTPDFKQLAAKCGESAPTGFVDIFAKPGQFASPGNEGSNGLLKQFSTRYIGYGDLLYGNPCDTSTYNQLFDMQTKLIDSLKSAFKTAT